MASGTVDTSFRCTGQSCDADSQPILSGLSSMHRRSICCFVFAALAFPRFLLALQGADGAPPSLSVLRVEDSDIDIDGRLNEQIWRSAPVGTGFTQRDPDDGSPATERTEVRVLISDDAIFVGVRAFDSNPAGIVGQLARRDEYSASDNIHVHFDSFHDHRTSFMFGVTPRGAIRDTYYFNDGRGSDRAWDAVWQVATSTDSLGWVAEFRIPFSQLRFARDKSTWGIQVSRRIERKAEHVFWAPWSKASSGFQSRFGDLHGLTDLPSLARLELRPYMVADGRRRPESSGSVYAPTSDVGGDAGFDLKYGISSDFTLDLTANPDFGQVEADPAVVNLTAFESFFPERRPFFVEGGSFLNRFIPGGQLFYSRRIGRRPQGWASPPTGGTVEIPDASTIVSAAKVTGKSGRGLGLGLLSALTTGENGTMRDSLGTVVGSERVQPWVHHFAGRVQQDFKDGQHNVGTMVTALNRFGGADEFGLRRAAYSFLVDGEHKWQNNTYSVAWVVAGSHIRGTEEVILAAQQSSRRYYQRPDADHLAIDSSRTSLSGYSFAAVASKDAGAWRYYAFYDRISPGLDITDLGFQRGSADRQGAGGGIGYVRVRPIGPFRNFRVGVDFGPAWTTGGEFLGFWFRPIFFRATFRNNWSFNINPMAFNVRELDITALRSGPALRKSTWRNSFARLNTDRRKPLSLSLNATVGGRFDGPDRWVFTNVDARIRPSATVNAAVGVQYGWSKDPQQWVTRRTVLDSTRYILATIRQQTLNVRIRFDWTLTPNLSLQLYAQPFVSSGAYSAYLEVEDPQADRWIDRFHFYGSELACSDTSCDLDRDADGIVDASFSRPDFNVKSLRATTVLRWEYKPGSVIYVAWQHGRSEFLPGGEFGGMGALTELLGLESDNTLLIKINYWLGM